MLRLRLRLRLGLRGCNPTLGEPSDINVELYQVFVSADTLEDCERTQQMIDATLTVAEAEAGQGSVFTATLKPAICD